MCVRREELKEISEEVGSLLECCKYLVPGYEEEAEQRGKLCEGAVRRCKIMEIMGAG